MPVRTFFFECESDSFSGMLSSDATALIRGWLAYWRYLAEALFLDFKSNSLPRFSCEVASFITFIISSLSVLSMVRYGELCFEVSLLLNCC